MYTRAGWYVRACLNKSKSMQIHVIHTFSTLNRLVNNMYTALHQSVLQGSVNKLHMCFASCKMHLECHITCIYMICTNSFKILILNIVCHFLFSSNALFRAISCSLMHILCIFCYLRNTCFVRLLSF